ncbi:subtilisin-like protein [Rhypophila sp. PSN 637]
MRADPGDIMPLRIGLAQRNVDLAPGWLLDVSDPKSANFGKHWSAQRVIETFTPSNETVDQVVQWLVDSGIDSERLALTPGYNWLLVHNTTVEEAEVLLNTTYYHYYYPGRDITRIGSEGYNLPESVKKHIDIIIPTTPYEGVQPIPQQVIGPGVTNLDGLAGLDTCQYLITIECLRHLYKFGPGNSSTPGNELGIAQWGDSLGPREDLDLFFNNFTTQPIPQSTAPELIDLNYGGDKENVTDLDIFGYIFGSESALDVQTAYSIVYPQNIRLYQVGADSSEAETRSNFDTLLDFFHTSAVIDGGEAITNVLSFSYLQTEVTLPIEYQRRQCIEWLKLGLQGVSVLFASGDSGVAANRDPLTGQTCLDGERFSPSFPANCPWVTTVGATSLGSKNIDDGEVALDNIPNPFEQADNQYISSGGGFSNVFDQPSYQKKAVSFYLDNYPPPYNNSVYNPSGRGFPDISALGQNISVIVNGNVQRGGGTSASTPIVASLVTLLNEERLAVGKRPIGFLNPILYAHPEAFNDVVEGSNPGCGTEGFRAAKGWDPVTGLGTPNYAKLRKIVLSLP